MSWAAVIAGGAALVGSIYSSQQGKKAGDKAAAGSNAAIAEQQRQFNTIMSMLAPQRQVGNNALNTLNRLYGFGNLPNTNALAAGGQPQADGGSSSGAGFNPATGTLNTGGSSLSPSFNFNPLDPRNALTGGLPGLPLPRAVNDTVGRVLDPFGIFGGKKKKPKTATPYQPAVPITPQVPDQTQIPSPYQTQGTPDMSVFFTSPDYNFRRNEGLRDTQNLFAFKGGAQSGNALRALNDFNSNLASGEFGNFINRQLAMAGLGQAATSNATQSALSTGQSIGNYLQNAGNARASGLIDQTNAITGGLNDLAGIYGSWMRNRQYGGG